MASRDLRAAVRADFNELREVASLHCLRIVAPAVGSMADQLTVAPALGGADMPDVLVVGSQAERRSGAQLLCHAGSLPASSAGSRSRPEVSSRSPVRRLELGGCVVRGLLGRHF
jgi:hypothetical protein